MVFKKIRGPIHDPRGKIMPNWFGLYIIKTIMQEGAVKLMDMNGEE